MALRQLSFQTEEETSKLVLSMREVLHRDMLQMGWQDTKEVTPESAREAGREKRRRRRRSYRLLRLRGAQSWVVP